MTATAAGPAPLLALNFGFARARVLGTALELGLFTELARAPRPARRLADDLDCDGEGLRRLLAALAELGLVEGDDDTGRRPTALAAAHLVEDAPGWLGGHFAEVLDQWDAWAALTDVVRGGRRPSAAPRRGSRPGFFGGAFPVTVHAACAVVDAVGPRPAGRVLDLVAGGGEWGIALAAADPDAVVVAHDDEELLPGVRARAERFGVASRFIFRAARDGRSAAFADASFDTVVLAHAARFAGHDATVRLVGEAARLLRTGGTLLVADVMRPEPGGDPLHRPMLDLSLFVNTAEGGLPRAATLRALMKEAGVTPGETVARGILTTLTGEKQERQ
ncbi:hypothetical protein GCM10010145_16280 [Streptomyces ruber]|uniref:Methyltransferase domain-containing protein n=2 Tax=Streptomyces TaxID=1883 RepID=A0A918ER40_9ACTN|nr:class I SAM-dependent methyltransferase [Streptomyces ruber]GGQ47903.1 hypothetical protein GCM10010145_16280 [Streptomyces ruber]